MATQPPLAERIRAREELLGLVVKMPNQALLEAAGFAGFDLVVLDTEHGLADGQQLEHHLRAADSVDLPSLVRVGSHAPIDALRALDAGAAGIILPHVNTARDARGAVDMAHYPPIGHRGLALSTRAGKYASIDLTEHLKRSAEETVVLGQVEHTDAVANIDDILATSHLDGVWIGPSDLSMSLGLPGEYEHPKFERALGTVTTAMTRHDSKMLAVIASTGNDVDRWRARGATMFLAPSPDLTSPALRGFVQRARLNTPAATQVGELDG